MRNYIIFNLLCCLTIHPAQCMETGSSWWGSFKSGCKKAAVGSVLIGGTFVALGATQGPERDYPPGTTLAQKLHARFWDGTHVMKESEIVQNICTYLKKQTQDPLEGLDEAEEEPIIREIIIDVDEGFQIGNVATINGFRQRQHSSRSNELDRRLAGKYFPARSSYLHRTPLPIGKVQPYSAVLFSESHVDAFLRPLI